MFSARSLVFAAIGSLVAALGSQWPATAFAETIDLSLNIFYATPSNANSGGTWELIAKSSGFGIAGLEALLVNTSSATDRAPRATVNGTDAAGFNVFANANHPTFRDLTFGQAPIDPFTAGKEQGAFYGAGTLSNGAPNYPAKPAGSNAIGPAFASLTAPIDIPWATGDAFNNPAWLTAARFASGTFAAGVTPSFLAGSMGSVFTSIGSSTAFGSFTTATVTTTVRTNFAGLSADYNHNGVVDSADYILWRNTQNQVVTPGSGADGNGDGTINQPDYLLWRANFGMGSSTGTGNSGDYNLNGTVDAADYALWRNTLNQSVAAGTGADGNGDGTVNQADYDLWRSKFGNAAGSGSGSGDLSTGAVPEPFSCLLLLVGVGLFCYAGRSFGVRRVGLSAPAYAIIPRATQSLSNTTTRAAEKG